MKVREFHRWKCSPPLAFSFPYLSLFLLSHLSGDSLDEAGAFLKPPLISHRSSSTEGGDGNEVKQVNSGWHPGRERQTVCRSVLMGYTEEWRPCPSSRCSQFQPSLLLLMELVHLSLSSSLLSSSFKPCQKGLPKDTGRQKQGKDFQDRWRGKERLWNIKHDEVSLEWSGMFSFWIFLGLLKYTSGRITAPLYVSVISRLEDLQKTF